MLFRALLLLVPLVAGFRIPFRLVNPAPVTNMTEAGQTLTQDTMYFVGNITIGTPPQTFAVIFDTESADLFIPDVSCNVPPGVCATDDCTGVFCADSCPDKKCCIQARADANSTCYGKKQFNSAMSSTYQNVMKVYTINDRFGPTTGFTGKDIVTFGDIRYDHGQAITVPDVTFLQATQFGNALIATGADGVFGLGFGALSQTQSTPPLVQAVQQGDIDESIFMIWLEHQNQTNDLGTHGVIFYGGYDPLHCSPTRFIFSLSGANHYQVSVTSFNATSGAASQQYNAAAQAYVDSANRYIEAPPSITNAILRVLGLPVNTPLPVNVPCNTKVTLNFNFPGGVSASVTEKDVIAQTAPGTCQLLVRSNQDRIVLGIPFFRGRCVYFDVVRHNFGFADALLQDDGVESNEEWSLLG